ncbi:S49 family peptidase [soil metagenome]
MQQRFINLLEQIGAGLGAGWQQLICALANLRRRIFRKRLPDYAVIIIDREIEERSPSAPWWHEYLPWRKTPLTIEEISHNLQRLAGDPAVKGVIFLLKGASLSLAQAQSISALFKRFRQWDKQYNPSQATAKQIIVHLEQISSAGYIVGCAADKISVTPLTTWEVLGLHSAPTFYKTTLARLGIAMDVVKIAPWKTAADQFSCAEMSPEFAQQMGWLFDSLYDDIVNAIHSGRNLSVATVQSLIDQAPWGAEQALAKGLIDKIAYEDELAGWLGAPDQPASLQFYTRIHKLLWRRPQRHHPQAIGVISLLGSITTGESRSFPIPLPLLGEQTIGSTTAEQQIRAARADDRLAAVILHVDSRGGSALASDLIWHELKLLDREKPVIVYMGDVAASGGYYIAAPGRKIVAQRATLTGSIGVIIAKPVTQDAYAKLGANRQTMQRGQHADIYQDTHMWDADQRDKIEASIRDVYGIFKARVAEGRALAYDNLDEICNGRVWTGAQAFDHKLIDALGDFQVALELACQVAQLPNDGSVETIEVTVPKRKVLAEPVQTIQALLGLNKPQQLSQLAEIALTGEWASLVGNERVWLIADSLPKLQ